MQVSDATELIDVLKWCTGGWINDRDKQKNREWGGRDEGVE